MASGAMTRTQQHTMVGEGLAVGVLLLGVVAVTSDRQVISSAFGRAWRAWARHPLFPAVRTDLAHEDIFGILDCSSRRRGAFTAYWSTGREYEPVLAQDWPLPEAGDHIGESIALSHTDWVDLARGFVADFPEGGVRREVS